jgi:hypothetical protein
MPSGTPHPARGSPAPIARNSLQIQELRARKIELFPNIEPATLPRMRILTCVAVLLLSCLPFVLAGCGDDSEQEVRDTYAQYVAAEAGRDLQTVLDLTDPAYIERLDFLVKIARTGERSRVQRMTPAEKLEVVMLRNRLTKKELDGMDGKKWLSRTTTEGWTEEMADEPEITLGKITVKKPRAKAQLIVNGIETDLNIEFVKTGDKWVMDPTPFEELINRIVRKLATHADAENLLIRRWEENSSGKKVADPIWDPPK